MATKIKLYRDLVLGYIVVQDSPGGYLSVDTIPIIGSMEGGRIEEFFSVTQQVVGVLQAPPDTFRISGYVEDLVAPITELGYEHAGVSNPDWVYEYGWQVNSAAMQHLLQVILLKIADDRGEFAEEAVLAAVRDTPLYEAWSADDVVLDDAARVHNMLEQMKDGPKHLVSLREGVYALKSRHESALKSRQESQ